MATDPAQLTRALLAIKIDFGVDFGSIQMTRLILQHQLQGDHRAVELRAHHPVRAQTALLTWEYVGQPFRAATLT